MIPFTGLEPKARLDFYKQVFELKSQGLGYKKIRRKMREEYGVNLSLGTLSYWFNNEVVNIGGENYFEIKPSQELSYVLGVMFGDGCAYCDNKKEEYILALEATDRQFVDKFAMSCSKLIKRQKTIATICNKARGSFKPTFSTKLRSKQVYIFVKSIKQEFEKGKFFIEQYPAHFIQGLADSEGSAGIFISKKIQCKPTVAVSTNHKLLEYVKYLLGKFFGIEAKLFLSKRIGESDSVINGRIITRTKDLYALQISKYENVKKFAISVGFSIGCKQQKLVDAISIIDSFPDSDQSLIWKEKYGKAGKFWVFKDGKVI